MKISEMVRERFSTPSSLDGAPFSLIQTLLMLEVVESLGGQRVSNESVSEAELSGVLFREGINHSAVVARKLLAQYRIERKS